MINSGCFRDSFFDCRHSDPADLLGDSEKQLRIPPLSKNFHYLFMLAVLWTADDETVYKNLVFTRGRVTERQEAVVIIDCEFNNHGPSLPMLTSSCKVRLAIEIIHGSQQKWEVSEK